MVALLITFSTFFNFSVSKKYVTKKLNRVLLARELSLSLATLACHQLRCQEIHDQSGALYLELSRPIGELSKQMQEKINFSAPLQRTLAAIVAANSELKNLSYSVSWLTSNEDFKPALSAYSREKIGVIRIPVEISYAPPGSEESITENYVYAVDVKVIANLVPVISRFTLYIADARSGEPAERFNQVFTDKSGNLKGSAFRPWVLNNGLDSSVKIPERFSEIIDSGRGLVFLGGGNLVLANARGWGTPGEFSEGFHLFKEGRGPAMYTVAWLGTTALINWEAGLCNDIGDADSELWYDLIKEGFEEEARHNSLFRLMGTDKHRSPTLVFGDVYTRTQCCRIFKSSSKAFGLLPYAKTQASFEKFKSGDDEKKDISFFISQVGNISLGYYNTNFASRLWELPFNRALGYVITDHHTPDPVAANQISTSDPLAGFISGAALANRTAGLVPAPYDKIAGVANELKNMQSFLQAMEIPGRRTAYEIEVKAGETLFKALEREGFLREGKLDLNGWAYVKSAQPLTFTSPISLVSHGGLVFAKGDIELNSMISSADGKFLLNLVTLEGDIKIASGVSGPVNAGFIANGQVRILGKVGEKIPVINGSVAMKQIRAGSLADSMARGVDINFDEKLAAVPFATREAGSEKTLLTYAIKWHPYLIQ